MNTLPTVGTINFGPAPSPYSLAGRDETITIKNPEYRLYVNKHNIMTLQMRAHSGWVDIPTVYETTQIGQAYAT